MQKNTPILGKRCQSTLQPREGTCIVLQSAAKWACCDNLCKAAFLSLPLSPHRPKKVDAGKISGVFCRKITLIKQNVC